MVVRDNDGRVMAALALVIPFIIDPTTVEAMATSKAIYLCRELSFSQVIFEGDSLTVVLALCNSPLNYRNRFENVFEDTRIRLQEFQSVRRSANKFKATHYSAKSALKSMSDEV